MAMVVETSPFPHSKMQSSQEVTQASIGPCQGQFTQQGGSWQIESRVPVVRCCRLDWRLAAGSSFFPFREILVTKVFSPCTFFLTSLPNSAISELRPAPVAGERHFVLCNLWAVTRLFPGF
jgi:hypothetical protein